MENIIKQWNLWWQNNIIPQNLTRKLRYMIKEIIKLIPTREIIILSGVRRAGKSTIIFQLIEHLLQKNVPKNNILYFNFDEPLESLNMKTIDKVYSTYLEMTNPKGRKYVFFDEIQNIPQWEKWIKRFYDMHGEDIKFILTGSNTSMLSDDLAKLLTGRSFNIDIFPLSFKEYLDFKNVVIKDIDLQKNEIRHYLSRFFDVGGFPEVVLEQDKDINHQRLTGYFDSILFRDIVKSKEIRESAKLFDLASYSLTNISNLFSYNKMSKAIGININSLREYLHYLENAYLIFQVLFFSYSQKQSVMVQQPRKIYSIDQGLRNANALKFSKDYGRLAENIVFLELKRRGYKVNYWKEKNEVDFIIQQDKLIAINVCYGKIQPREIEGLLSFRNKFKKQVKQLVIITNDIEKNENNINFIPLWKWLLTKQKLES